MQGPGGHLAHDLGHQRQRLRSAPRLGLARAEAAAPTISAGTMKAASAMTAAAVAAPLQADDPRLDQDRGAHIRNHEIVEVSP
jgi:hypothetical protein